MIFVTYRRGKHCVYEVKGVNEQILRGTSLIHDVLKMTAALMGETLSLHVVLLKIEK